MPRAAVPDYLGQHFDRLLKEASPGLRFGMYLPIWTSEEDQERAVNQMASRRSPKAAEVARTRDQQGMQVAIEHHVKEGRWDKNDFASRNAWDAVTPLNESDRHRMTALAKRQDALVATLPEATRLSIDAVGIAPFVTGMGNEHPLENGFSFLDPHGLPYLPGSGVKGVLRAAAEELASGDWGDAHGWDHQLKAQVGKDGREMRVIDLLFGHDPQDGQRVDADLFRGLLDTWDVIPQVKGNRLMVEIMTPHQGDYYQGKAAPHDSGQPNPISFLAVPPGSGYTFHLRIDSARVGALGLESTLGAEWKRMVEAAFEHAFEWLGFGAKTSVGYGAMMPDPAVAERRAEIEKEREQKREEATLSPEQLELKRFRDETGAVKQSGYTPGGPFDETRNAFIKAATEWTDAAMRREAADALDASFSNKWGASKKKARELKAIIADLRGE